MSNDLIEEIKTMASLLYTPEQVGIALGLESDEVLLFMSDPACDFYQAYYSGWFTSDMKLRNSMIKLALAGSSPAQAVMLKIIAQNEIRNSL